MLTVNGSAASVDGESSFDKGFTEEDIHVTMSTNGVSVGLVPNRIQERAKKLALRMEERGFAEHDLHGLAEEVAREASLLRSTVREFHRTRWVRRSLLLLAYGGFILILVVSGWLLFRALQLDHRSSNWSDFVQGADALLQIVMVILGGVTVFLWRSLAASKRKPVLVQLQRLTAIAQAIDEAQLDVDPDQLLRDKGHSTPASPKHAIEFTPFSMARFLDYCVDLHALISMCAAYLSSNAFDEKVRVEAWNVHRLTDGFRSNVGRDIQSILPLIPRELAFKPPEKNEPATLTEATAAPVLEIAQD